MNDFTKEELRYFLTCIKQLHWMHNRPIEPIEFYNKLHSLIDNYCEHEEKTPDNRECFGCDTVFCSACGGALK